jgi:hypothetical protein
VDLFQSKINNQKSSIGNSSSASNSPTTMKRIVSLLAALCLFQSSHAATAVPDAISFQGRALTATGALMGSGTPVNRTVTFRIWDHASNSLTANLLYSEQQVVTIAEGEFSVLIGTGTATAGTLLGYSETGKGLPTMKISDAFGGVTRYLGVTIDDGTAAVDNEISPRQQFVTSTYAMRAKVAEGVDGSAITTAMLANSAVTTSQVGDAAITNSKLAANAVTATQIVDATITTTKLADASVTTLKLADANVTTAKLADANVTTGKLADASVTTAKLADSAVTSAKIAAGTIAADNLAAGSVTSTAILDGTIATADMANSAVTGAKIATDTVIAGNIAAGAVGTSEIADGSITASDLGAAGITGDETSQLRIVRGAVAANGTTINNGSGFTPTKISPTSPIPAGSYRVRFATPFSSTPAVTVSGNNPAGTLDVRATVYNASSLGFDIGVVVNGAWSDASGYSFIAIGPR